MVLKSNRFWSLQMKGGINLVTYRSPKRRNAEGGRAGVVHHCPGAQPARRTGSSLFRGAVAQGAATGIPRARARQGHRVS
jgi:hypothetical protein